MVAHDAARVGSLYSHRLDELKGEIGRTLAYYLISRDRSIDGGILRDPPDRKNVAEARRRIQEVRNAINSNTRVR